MLKPCWPYIKKKTTPKGAPASAKTTEKAWIDCWKDIEQGCIQRWMERIVRHIQKIIELHRGNEYREGATEIQLMVKQAVRQSGPVETSNIYLYHHIIAIGNLH
jgi:hypothetical protein